MDDNTTTGRRNVGRWETSTLNGEASLDGLYTVASADDILYLLRSTPIFVAARLLCKGACCLSKICFGKSQRWLPLKQPPSGWTDFHYFIWQLSVAASSRLVSY